MRLPNKITTYQESDIAKYSLVLGTLENGSMSVSELYSALRSHVSSISDYLNILDSLYTLGKIDLDTSGRMLRYVA